MDGGMMEYWTKFHKPMAMCPCVLPLTVCDTMLGTKPTVKILKNYLQNTPGGKQCKDLLKYAVTASFQRQLVAFLCMSSIHPSLI